MSNRSYFILTAISGMIGMLSLITISICRFWISENPVTNLSDEGIDELLIITHTVAVAFIVSQAAIAAFIVFLILFLVTRRTSQESSEN